MKLGYLFLIMFTIDFFSFYGGVCTTESSLIQSFVTTRNTTVTPNYGLVESVANQTQQGVFAGVSIFPDYVTKIWNAFKTIVSFVGAPLVFLGCAIGLPTVIVVFITGVWILLTVIAAIDLIRLGT